MGIEAWFFLFFPENNLISIFVGWVLTCAVHDVEVARMNSSYKDNSRPSYSNTDMEDRNISISCSCMT